MGKNQILDLQVLLCKDLIYKCDLAKKAAAKVCACVLVTRAAWLLLPRPVTALGQPLVRATRPF